MRIGFFTDSYFPEIDGVTYTLEAWKKELEERGHQVFVFYPHNSGYEPGKNEIPIRSLPNPFYSGYRAPVPLGIDIPDLDIIHCHGPLTGRAGRFYGWRNNIPTVFTHHTPIEDYFEQNVKSKLIARILGKAYVGIDNRFLRGFDKITASTSIGRDVDAEKLPVGVDTRFFKPTSEKMFKELDGPVIGYSGRLSIEKNVDRIIKLTEDFEGTLVIVGEGPQKENLESMAGENVVFKDFLPRDKLPIFYSSIDCYVTASTGDTLGLAPLESNACGTPVLAPNVHPFNETIGEQNGERYDLKSEQDFLDSLEKCLNSDYSTRKAVENISLDRTVEKLVDLYKELDD